MTQITLRTAVVLPFVMIFLITIGVIVATQKSSYQQMVEDVSVKRLTALTDNVTKELDNFLKEPFQAAQSIGHSIGFNNLYNPNDGSEIQSYLLTSFEDLYSSIDQLDVIGFGGEGGEYIGYRKEPNDGYTLMIKDRRTEQNLIIYRGQTISSDVRTVIRNYDPRVRPWYTPVSQSFKPAWSSIYANADERQEVTLSALTPVFDRNSFLGVIGLDIKINTFNNFLKQLRNQTTASVFIFDQDKRLVAHSNNSSVISWGTERSEKGQRLLAVESPNPIIQASAQYAQSFTDSKLNQTSKFETFISGEHYFNHITPYRDEHGLQWYIGVSISESDLLGNLPENQRNSWLIGLVVSLIGIGLGLIAFNRVTRPITSTASAAKHLAKGDWDATMPKPGNIYETSMLVYAFNEMTNNLKASFNALRAQLLYDSLTNLYSREGFIDSCDKLPNLNGTLMLIGINKFRDINDSLGHSKGDELLIVIADRFKDVFSEECYIARIAGDEFALYHPNLQSYEDIQLTANRIAQMFASPFEAENENVVVNTSIGIVISASSPDTNMTHWLRNGSIALSNAKQDISNISYYRPEMADISRQRTSMLSKIKTAAEKNEFIPFYQPIVDLNSGDVIGAEALARWLSPQSGLIPPLDFIPVAEESGLISVIGEQILVQSCQDLKTGIEQGKWSNHFQMHVNVSVNQLSQPEFIDVIKRAFDKTGIDPSCFTLEITESRIVSRDPVVLSNMEAIRALGVHIAIDDFGTGYSSLAYLHKLPFDCLKIDRTFIEKMDPDNLDTSIVAAIINMTKGMKVNIVAEGIETTAQAQMLTQLHCNQGQGFLYSRPVPFEEWPTHLVNMK
ncbi:EAL domain-containing protein [Vibrio sp. DBSS07]|uniref:EAL domain-containing protein n=1 Tax=Vibrio paucivorans TaxID=2829489 RepID=A0A9X3HU14_9VIBR|nr:EAL domain-containing protein [Vibrio paucivorans]MCW8336159.1 EAL domain-containing protein [Vibrio paucivorans]